MYIKRTYKIRDHIKKIFLKMGWIKIPFLIFLIMLLTWAIFVFLDFNFLQDILIEVKSFPSSSIFWIFAGFLGADVFLPIPSTVIFTLAGNTLGIFLGFLSTTLGMLACSSIGYLLGFHSDKLFFKKMVSEKDKKTMNLWNNKVAGWIVIISKGLPILNETICLTCGFTKMNFVKYTLFSLSGIVPIAFIYSLFGYIAETAEQVLIIICFGFLVSFILAVLIRRKYVPSNRRNKR